MTHVVMAARGVRALRRIAQQRRWLCSQQSQAGGATAVSAEDGRVQELILRLTGLDLDRVFAKRKEPLTVPEYKLMTMEELRQEHTATVERAQQLVRMAPVLPERAPRDKVLERSHKLSGATGHTIIFTDISQHKENQDRRIVAREPDGTLREASWAERDRMYQAYFPQLGRKMWLPPMLREGKNLERLLRQRSHLHVLEVACVQCEPDSADCIRVHHKVYEDIDKNGLYDLLRSSRHFGGLVWYLVLQPRINGLLRDMLERCLHDNAADLVELYLLCHPGSEFANEVLGSSAEKRVTGWELVEAYCRHSGLQERLAELLERGRRGEGLVGAADSGKTEDELIIERMTARDSQQ